MSIHEMSHMFAVDQPKKFQWFVFEKQLIEKIKKTMLVTHEDKFYHLFMIVSCFASLTSIIMYGEWAALRKDVEF